MKGTFIGSTMILKSTHSISLSIPDSARVMMYNAVVKAREIGPQHRIDD